MTVTPEPESVLAYLRSFPTAAAMAEECRRLGVRGSPRDSECCLVAELLKRKIGGHPYVEVCPGGMDGGTLTVDDQKGLPLPLAADVLACDFDAELPELADLRRD